VPTAGSHTVSDLLSMGLSYHLPPLCGTFRPPKLPRLKEEPTVKKALTVATTIARRLQAIVGRSRRVFQELGFIATPRCPCDGVRSQQMRRAPHR
jgi:hypothetical protein